MREIVLDTETTGFDPETGDRMVEIGCIELMHRLPTGREFHRFMNPERDMPEAAYRVHGLSSEFLADKPLFAEIAEDFLLFIGDAPLVIHNAAFDMKFINAELTRIGWDAIPMSRAFDTVAMARAKFPGSPASLDALCKRFSIDLTVRDKHGALVDSQLLAAVYLELLGGRQAALELAALEEQSDTQLEEAGQGSTSFSARHFPPSADETAAHAAFLQSIKNPLWAKFSAEN
jgi:DNA polymerase-3 subunit epsilon